MTNRRFYLGLALALAVLTGLSVGAWYQYRAGKEKSDPRQALEQTTAEFIAAVEMLKRDKKPLHISAARLDQAFLLLDEIGQITGSSLPYNFSIYNRYISIWSASRGSTPPSVLLEIGPGVNLGQAVIFLLTGAKKYYGLDIHRDAQFYSRYPYDAVVTLLSRYAPHAIVTRPEKIFRSEGDAVTFNSDAIEYLFPRQSFDIPLPAGSVDYVFSHSVLEHISDPDATIRAIFRVLPSGGLTAHHFDLRDHTDFSNPLEFLKVDAKTWKARFDEKTAYMSTNRWRLSDFRAAFERAGFEIQTVEVTSTVDVTEKVRRSLHPDFQEYPLDVLSAMSALIVAAKP